MSSLRRSRPAAYDSLVVAFVAACALAFALGVVVGTYLP